MRGIIRSGSVVRCALVVLMATMVGGGAAWGAEAREIGGNKQLFVDEDMVASMEGVACTLNPARRAERVLTATEPWEASGTGYCSVIKDGDRFRMWYSAWYHDPTIKGNWMDRLAYAESKDGIHWDKPRLGQYEFQGSKQNNLIAVGKCGYVHGACVFIDPHAKSPDEKYKMVFGDFYRVYPYPGCPRHTTPHGRAIPWGVDTQVIAFWDPHIDKYVAYLRENFYRKDDNGKVIQPASRRIARTECETFGGFPLPVETAAPDDKDPGGAWGCGLYNTAATLYPEAPGVYLFFPTVMVYETGLCFVQFASSRDGIHLDRRFREPYVAVAPNAKRLGKQIGHTIGMGPGVVRVGDELWMYGCDRDVPHDAAWYGRSIPGGVQRYVQRLDGFVSLDAGYKPGTIVTKPFVLRGRALELNVDATFGPGDEPYYKKSSVEVAILSLEGKVLASSEPVYGDGVALTPTWKDGVDLAGLVGQPAQLRFGMRMAKIYAFQVADADPVRVRRSASLPPAATTKEEAGQVDPVSEAK